MVQTFFYRPKHLKEDRPRRFRFFSIPLVVILVIVGMVVGGLLLTRFVEGNISKAIREQEQRVQSAVLTRPRPPQVSAPEPTVDREQPFGLDRIISPVSGNTIRGIGWFKHPVYQTWQYHDGYDLQVQAGTVIRALYHGTVAAVSSGYDEEGLGPKGFRISIDHGEGALSFYIFPGQVRISPGDQVITGEALGTISSTGNDGIQIHIGLRSGDHITDWLGALENRG